MAKALLILALLGGLIEDVNKAKPGSVINVSAGSYPGGTITNNVILVANGDAKFTSGLILKGAVTLDGFVFGDRNGQLIEVRASNCVIRNCAFRRFGKSGSSKAIWIREQAKYNNTLIDNCLFDDWSRSSSHSSCVKVSQDGGAQHQGTIIRNCTSSNGADGGNSVAFQLYASTLVEDNLIHHVEDAIEVKGSNCIIRRNHLHNNTVSSYQIETVITTSLKEITSMTAKGGLHRSLKVTTSPLLTMSSPIVPRVSDSQARSQIATLGLGIFYSHTIHWLDLKPPLKTTVDKHYHRKDYKSLTTSWPLAAGLYLVR
jgi:hypothetical protein